MREYFVENNTRNKTNFIIVIFSDEKRFTLNGPNNIGVYFYKDSVNTKKQSRTKRFGIGVMILGVISSNENLKIKIVKLKYNTERYKKVFRNYFLS